MKFSITKLYVYTPDSGLPDARRILSISIISPAPGPRKPGGGIFSRFLYTATKPYEVYVLPLDKARRNMAALKSKTD
jgi:hypothetical protein